MGLQQKKQKILDMLQLREKDLAKMGAGLIEGGKLRLTNKNPHLVEVSFFSVIQPVCFQKR